MLVRLAAGLGTFWRAHCHFSEGRRWLDRALALTSGQRSPVRADLLRASGHISRARGDLATAEAQYREALAIREELGDGARVAQSLRLHGQRRLRARRPRRRRGLVAPRPRPARAGRTTTPSSWDVLNNLGVVAHQRGDEDEAIRLYDASYELGHRLGSLDMQARAQMNKASALAAQGDFDQARTMAAASVVSYAYLDDTWDLVDALDVLAGAVGRGAADAALSGWLFGAATGLRTALGVRRMPVEQDEYELGFGQSRVTDAASFDAAYAEGAAASVDQIVVRATRAGGAG